MHLAMIASSIYDRIIVDLVFWKFKWKFQVVHSDKYE